MKVSVSIFAMNQKSRQIVKDSGLISITVQVFSTLRSLTGIPNCRPVQRVCSHKCLNADLPDSTINGTRQSLAQIQNPKVPLAVRGGGRQKVRGTGNPEHLVRPLGIVGQQ